MTYFDSHYVSNSDLKEIVSRVNGGFEKPENIEEIYSFGTLSHAMIFQPHLADVGKHSDEEIELTKRMRGTFMEDRLCRDFITMPDFRTEHEWYREDFGGYGVKGRCKADGDSKMLRTGLEFKGLGITTQSAFKEAIDRFAYDQGVVWYMDGTGYDRWLIAAISKKNPKKLFKELVDKDHPMYKSGRKKIDYSVGIFKQYIPA